MHRFPTYLAALALSLIVLLPTFAWGATGALLIVDSAGKQSVAGRAQRTVQIAELSAETLKLAEQLIAEIGAGKISQNGPNAPSTLEAFSKHVLNAIPDLFERRSVSVITSRILPIEMVRRGDLYFGDVAEISHEFPDGANTGAADRRIDSLPMSRYVIEAVIGMPKEISRKDQDIVRVALDLEREIPVELNFGGGAAGFTRILGREDISILHIDTHGGPDGRSIQIGRDGSMIESTDIKSPVRAPLVLLFGCEGAAGHDAFGAILHVRGARAVISSFAKFNSFGLTGTPDREHRIYETFFSSLRAGHTVGTSLVALRQAALQESQASPHSTSLTRLLFILIGRDDFSFTWP